MAEQTQAEAAIPRSGAGARLARRFADFRRLMRGNPNMALGLAILTLAALMALFAPVIAVKDPQALDPVNKLQPPSASAFFGTDFIGRDVFSRSVFGSRLSLAIGASVTAITLCAGVVIGIFSGYYKLADNIIMRFMDGLMAFPSFLLAIALVALLGASFQNVVIALSVVETPRVVRIVRGSVLSLRERQYVEGAVAVGARPLRVLFTHIFPNLIAPLTVQATFVFALAILVEAGLSFLGAGVPPHVPSWGNMMGEAKLFIQQAVWTIFFPGLFLSLTVLGANLVGDGLRDTLDPRLRRTG